MRDVISENFTNSTKFVLIDAALTMRPNHEDTHFQLHDLAKSLEAPRCPRFFGVMSSFVHPSFILLSIKQSLIQDAAEEQTRNVYL